MNDKLNQPTGAAYHMDVTCQAAAIQHALKPAAACLHGAPVGGGSPHKPSILDAKGYVVHESSACARYLLARGLPAGVLLKEIASHDTVGNAYFSLTSHVIPAAWTRLAVVTSEFHMPRARHLFTDMFALAAQELWQQPDR